MEDNSDYSKLEESLVISEYESLREEIQARLTKVFQLQQGLLLGTLIYATTFYLPNLLNANTVNQPSELFQPLVLLYYSFIFVLPFIAFVVELLCTSEQDAIFRAGTYIRDNIEKIYRQSTFRGWEDWLNRQDKVARRRTSDNLIVITRRYIVIPLYCIISSFICTIGFVNLLQIKLNISDLSLLVLCIVGFYFIIFYPMLFILKIRQKQEFSSPLYDLLVLDLDGCLLNRKKEISKANNEAISFLKKRGVHIILATGRGSLSLKHFCEELDLKERHVTCHGATIFDASKKTEKLIACLLKDDLKIIMRKLKEVGIIWVAFGEENYYCRQRDYETVKRNLVDRKDLRKEDLGIVTGVDDELDHDFPEISKILCYVNVSDKRIRNELTKSLSKQFTVMMSTGETLEIINKKALKEEAVKKIIQDLNLKIQKSIVVGDYDNDISILKWGDHAVAPSNASMRVSKVKGVNVLETSNDEDLIWEIARAYFSLRGIKPNNNQYKEGKVA